MLFASPAARGQNTLIALREALRLRMPAARCWVVGYQFPTGKELGLLTTTTSVPLPVFKGG